MGFTLPISPIPNRSRAPESLRTKTWTVGISSMFCPYRRRKPFSPSIRNISGAKVIVDGENIGLTDLKEAQTPPACHDLKVIKSRYRGHAQPAPHPAGSLLLVERLLQNTGIKVDGLSETFYQENAPARGGLSGCNCCAGKRESKIGLSSISI